ncbi:pyruvate dehydrogenase [acetyl-transferring]-phosphatase 1, mitochondrial isoform X2 [Bombyx mandarina]|uniref:PPM-type phosphatase domain-containing protein n=2 Tax=Bombyx TaxID=7090 RepID=A0A8R2AMU9_BOMMO|nr:pyruvate dehydrogenase [acetyl-transferring]-phosphatase 1, mitochondrial isoform X2 [Bombyx mori]XP_028033003.1 pyruvate dehydrogenase [acetyl-transferring]-phosphatase 1, mitochondrial isoform X2 [Bombyx mandarina]
MGNESTFQNNLLKNLQLDRYTLSCFTSLISKVVTTILRKNEFNKEFTTGSIKCYDSNQLASNDPIEDTRCEAQCRMTSGLIMGVFDGHGGPACAQVISKRLVDYIAAALLPIETLHKYIQQDPREALVDTFNNRVEILQELKILYERSFRQYLAELANLPHEGYNVPTALEQAIIKIDQDLSKEAVEPYKLNQVINPQTLSVALSGAVACVTHVDGPNLHIANVGDCNAVLGILTEDKEWIAKKITKEHNSENFDELKRIWNEHPDNERKTVIRRDRLLGELAPLRSLGDYRYKWPIEILMKVAVPLIGPKAIPANYHTPPYLTAKPDLYYHRLSTRDKFLILASDGLWDMMTPLQAVKLVGEHMKGKVFFNPLKLPRKNIQLGDINELLLHRKESLKSKPKDRNAATHLIRHAIGGTEYGVDHSRLAHLLSLSPDVSRMFRDDITVTVMYFDSEFLRQCPA